MREDCIVSNGLRRRLTSYGDQGFSLFLRKAFIKAMGYSDDALDRPIVGIANTYSDYNPCHGNVPQLIDAVKRGPADDGISENRYRIYGDLFAELSHTRY